MKAITVTTGRLLLPILVVAALLGPIEALEAVAGDLRGGARVSGLTVGLRATRARVERAPRASSYDLDRARRQLHWQRLEHPRDPRVDRLAIEIDQLQRKADRALRQQSRQRGFEARAGSFGVRPDPARDPGANGDHWLGDRPRADIGARLVAIQQLVILTETQLAAGQTATAGTSLERARAGLDQLTATLGSPAVLGDPNITALATRIEALQDQL